MTTGDLVVRLCRRGQIGLTAAELAPEIEATRDAASQHLRRLERGGRLRRTYYPLTPLGDRLVWAGDTVRSIRGRLDMSPAADAAIRRGLMRAGRGGHIEIRWVAT